LLSDHSLCYDVLMKTTQPRMSKEDRRAQIIEAATREFAPKGLYGTPVTDIAAAVGVSQPYLFMLFGTKKELFLAAVRRSFERTLQAFRVAATEAGADADAVTVLMAMGLAYHRLLDDRTLLLMQLQAYAACEDPDVRETVRAEFVQLMRFVQDASGAPDDAVRAWLAEGMLMNVGAAMDLAAVPAEWARMCLDGPVCHVGTGSGDGDTGADSGGVDA
jgi:AcrR family transcriptional regulator